MQIRAMSQNLTHNPHNYRLILYQFFVFTQNLKQSPKELYEKVGFVQKSESFLEDGIPHVLMQYTE